MDTKSKPSNVPVVNIFCVALLVIVAAATQACTPAPPPAPAPVEEPVEEEVMYTHTVRYSGETLGLIARWYTGKTTNWEAILEANPGLRPERINLRDEILVPETLMTRKEPMPESFVRQAISSLKSSGGGAEASTEGMADDGLFDDIPKPEEDAAADAEPAEEAESSGAGGAATAADDALVDELLNELAQDEDTSKPDAEGKAGAAAEKKEDSTDDGVPSEAERERLLDELLGE